MKLKPIALGMASGLSFAILWVICSILVAVSPGMMMQMSGQMFHMDLSQMSWSLQWSGFFIGLIVWAVMAGFAGWLIGLLYNRFASD